jgi:hypothetical protein
MAPVNIVPDVGSKEGFELNNLFNALSVDTESSSIIDSSTYAQERELITKSIKDQLQVEVKGFVACSSLSF